MSKIWQPATVDSEPITRIPKYQFRTAVMFEMTCLCRRLRVSVRGPQVNSKVKAADTTAHDTNSMPVDSKNADRCSTPASTSAQLFLIQVDLDLIRIDRNRCATRFVKN